MAASVKVTILKENETKQLTAAPGKTLLELLREAGEFIDAPCGGKGRCGKCLVQILQGEYLSEKHLPEGFCLACNIIPQSDITLRIPKKADEYQMPMEESRRDQTSLRQDEWGIAVDIGTTTIAMYGILLATGEIIDTWNLVNSQRVYGADVVSRIEAAINGKSLALAELLRGDIYEGIQKLIDRSSCPELLKSICIAGNTTMLHLLRGYDCIGLSRVPFTPVTLDMEEIAFSCLVPEKKTIPDAGTSFLAVPTTLLPGISAFVGADITAGIYLCDMDISEEISLLIDFGTNAEMVIGSRKGMLCSSAAAGPAFEGGNISHGMGSLPGAIQRVAIREGAAEVTTIGDQPPKGICGTGVLDAAAELYKAGLMDETGLLEDEFFDDGFPLCKNAEGQEIMLTQKDIREIQLAKAAIRAGIETLMKEAGTCAEKVDRVFIAGGFGFYMDMEKAITIGLLPQEFTGKIQTLGNSSLSGAAKYLQHGCDRKRLDDIKENCVCIDLSQNKDFHEGFITYMDFQGDFSFS